MNVMQLIRDCLREQRIRDMCAKVNSEPNRALKRLWWLDAQEEIKARSPGQLARMERASYERQDAESRAILDRHKANRS